jgi:hypothetical protein
MPLPNPYYFDLTSLCQLPDLLFQCRCLPTSSFNANLRSNSKFEFPAMRMLFSNDYGTHRDKRTVAGA